MIICAVEEQPGDRWFLEKIRYDAGSSPTARSHAEFVAGCYKMWRHSLALLTDTRNSIETAFYMLFLQHDRSLRMYIYSLFSISV